MSEELQSLLEKINREGLEKAEREAKAVLADAKAKADAILAEAKGESARLKAEGEKAAADAAARAAVTIRQAARDTINAVEGEITALLERILVKDVEKSLADEATVLALVTEAVKGLAGEAEVALPAKLAAALKAQLAARPEITVVTDEAVGTGFTIRTEGGRVEHSFTGRAIADAIARRLRPELAELVK